MKIRSCLLILILACMCAVTGCRSAAPTDIKGETQAPVMMQSDFPDEPPHLYVTCAESTVRAWRGTYSWEIRRPLGLGEAVMADSHHPLDIIDEIPFVAADSTTEVSLTFAEHPDSITVNCYRPDGDPGAVHSTVKINGTTFSLSEEDMLYEVIAEWNSDSRAYSGCVYYAFRTEQ